MLMDRLVFIKSNEVLKAIGYFFLGAQALIFSFDLLGSLFAIHIEGVI